jgi:hypothetical protein
MRERNCESPEEVESPSVLLNSDILKEYESFCIDLKPADDATTETMENKVIKSVIEVNGQRIDKEMLSMHDSRFRRCLSAQSKRKVIRDR